MITAEELRAILHYDPSTGIFTWVASRSNAVKRGQIAGAINGTGYRTIKIGDTQYRAHRLAWFYCHGEWPPQHIDHINGKREDNRLTNLRQCTNQQNIRNMRRTRRNSSGFKGACWHKPTKKWLATICINRKKIFLGYYETPEEAHAAYLAAAKKHFGEFARAA